MRRFFTILAALFVFVGCSQDDVVTPNAPIEKPTYYASFADAEADSRTYLDENFMLLWHNDDRISLFATTYNEEYAFADATGSNSGAFNAVDKDSYVTGNTISTTYAVYPYNAANAISNSEILTIHFPAEQSYAEDSFGRGANTMVAAAQSSSSKLLPFRNAGGYMVLKLYGENKTVKSIELKGNNEEVISGAATAEAKYGYLPLITMGAEGGKTITLICQNAVELGATEAEATTFWIVVPPITFEEGFTITVTDADGGTYTKSTSKPTTITRNEIKSMSALAPTFTGETENPENTKPANNEIWYTATEKVVKDNWTVDTFGANITDHTFDTTTGKGVITFDGEVTKIGSFAFYECRSLTSVTIPNSVTDIRNHAFVNCGGLTSIIIPDSVTSIEVGAFESCDGLTSITIPDGVTKIEYGAFKYCDGLTSITIPNSVTQIGINPFENCENLAEFKGKFASEDGRCLIVDGVLNSFAPAGITTYNIPNSVTEIGNYAFESCSGLTSVTIPNGVTEIDDWAFLYCPGLTSITIPDSVTKIRCGAFYGCSGLTSVTIPDGVTEIGDLAFYYCSGLTNIAIGNGVTSIGTRVFYHCDGLTSITIPDSVTEIGSYAFEYCPGLTSVTIGNGVTEIGSGAFYDCANIVEFNGKFATSDKKAIIVDNVLIAYAVGCIDTEYTIPDGVTEIGDSAFRYSYLTSITIPDSVTEIGDSAFYNCDGLTSVTIPDSVTEIGDYAFYDCDSLTSVTIPDSVTEIGDYAFYDCDSLTSVTIPDSVTSIGDYAFCSCDSLTSVTIPDSVTSIGDYAFCSCDSLTSVTIPDNVTEIGDCAFRNCTKLCEIYCKALTPPVLGADVFTNNASDRKFYVPYDGNYSTTYYENAEGWSEYKNYIYGTSSFEY